VTSSLAVLKAAIRVKSTHLIKLCSKTKGKEKYGNYRYFYINLFLKDRLDIEFTACYSNSMGGNSRRAARPSENNSSFRTQMRYF